MSNKELAKEYDKTLLLQDISAHLDVVLHMIERHRGYYTGHDMMVFAYPTGDNPIGGVQLIIRRDRKLKYHHLNNCDQKPHWQDVSSILNGLGYMDGISIWRNTTLRDWQTDKWSFNVLVKWR